MDTSDSANCLTASWDPQRAYVAALAQDLGQVVRLARALAEAGRDVDLGGLDRQIGLLCAKTLDLPLSDGRDFRLVLTELHGDLEMLGQSMARRRG